MNPIFILAAIVLFLMVWHIVNTYLRPKHRKKVIYSQGIAKTAYPEDPAPNFNTWVNFMILKYDLRFKPTPETRIKDTQQISYRSR